MTKRSTSFDSVIVLQIVVAVFLFTLGLIGLIGWNSNLSEFGRGLNRLFGRANDPFNLIVAILELASGVVVIGGLFVTASNRLLYVLTFVIAILWVVEIIIEFFAQSPFEPNFIVWLNRLAADVITLGALWLINRRYA
jgi:hypothetical protein